VCSQTVHHLLLPVKYFSVHAFHRSTASSYGGAMRIEGVFSKNPDGRVRLSSCFLHAVMGQRCEALSAQSSERVNSNPSGLNLITLLVGFPDEQSGCVAYVAACKPTTTHRCPNQFLVQVL
jgi:hypothetical protein